MKTLNQILHILPNVANALEIGLPVVALESAVITHGLPHPENFSLAQDLESIVRDEGAIPATIGVLNGEVHIGLSSEEMERLATCKNPRKISRRDYALAISRKLTGGTTVAGTLIAAHLAGISVFATGGIGGVHRESSWDISADLPELGRTPLVVVCTGAKAILDLPATLEYLETSGVIVIGYKTNEFPAFYSHSSGLMLDTRLDSPEEVASAALAQRKIGIQSSLLVAQPPPAEMDIPPEVMEDFIQKAIKQAQKLKISGPALTPYLLEAVKATSGGASLMTNMALLRQNARLAAQIAKAMSAPTGVKRI